MRNTGYKEETLQKIKKGIEASYDMRSQYDFSGRQDKMD
jgi:hypothetical protein